MSVYFPDNLLVARICEILGQHCIHTSGGTYFPKKIQVWVVQKVDNTIHWINQYPADSVVCFVNIYSLASE